MRERVRRLRYICRTRLRTPLDWRRVDRALLAELEASLPKTNDEGCLLDVLEDLRTREQVFFLTSLLRRIRPRYVVEVGTHKAMFDYVARLCLPDVRIDTFGNLPESALAVRVLNEHFGTFATFHLGDSAETFSDFRPPVAIGFAWVDGGHSYRACQSDLDNCDRLSIPHIAVDDYDKIEEVRRAVTDFVRRAPYRIAARSSRVFDYRGIVYLRRKG